MFAADDFETIRARMREIRGDPPETKSDHKWEGSSPGGLHCSHCPRPSDKVCALPCKGEAVKQGLTTETAVWPPI